jgi:DnaJ family protein C protein 8
VYRSKSLLIHPDKTRNPQAPDAFDRLKKAQTELMDEKHRERLDEAIADARMLLMREKKLTVDDEEVKHPSEQFRKEWREKAKMVLIDNEHRRRRQLKAQMQEEGREKAKEEAEIEERKRKREHEQEWEKTRDERIGSWRNFQAGKKSSGDGDGGKKKKKKLKVLG